MSTQKPTPKSKNQNNQIQPQISLNMTQHELELVLKKLQETTGKLSIEGKGTKESPMVIGQQPK